MKKFKVEIFRNMCKSCQLCMMICPKQVFTTNERGQVVVKDDEQCIGCLQCFYVCPDLAVEVNKNAP